MELTWQHSALLFGLALVPLLALVQAGLRRKWSWPGQNAFLSEQPWRFTAVALLAAVLLILAAAGPVIHRSRPTDQLVVLIDCSAAARTAPWHTPGELRQLLLRQLSPQIRVTLVTFARYPHLIKRNVTLGNAKNWPRRWPATQHVCARLERALAWRDSHAGATGRHVPRWLLTTGLADWPAWSAAQRRQNGRHPYFLTVSTARPKKPDAGILSFRITPLPGAPAQKTGFAIRAVIAATGAMRLTAELQRNGDAIASGKLRFNQAGENIFTARDFPPEKTTAPARYTIYLKTGDPWPEDDSASAYAPQTGPPRILLISRRATPASVWGAAGAGTRPEFDSATGISRIPPQAFPVRVATLAEYQVILLDNIARGDLPPHSGRAIMRYVTRTGGGLLIAGGTRAFGPGGYALPTNAGAVWPVEQLSPLASAPPHRSARNVVFLLDSSGSMGQRVPGHADETRFNLAAGGVEAALHLLKPTDTVSIMTFSGGAHLLASGKLQAIDSGIAAKLAGVQPTGPTNPDAALPSLGRLLKKKSLLILLTDGHIPIIATMKWADLIKEKRAAFVVVAGYKRESKAFATLLRQTRARAMATRNPADWAWLIKQVVGKYLAGHAGNSPMLWQAATAAVSGTTTHWIRTWLKRGAARTAAGRNLAHPGHKGLPLAAQWRRGLGKVGAIAFADHSIEFANFADRMIQRIAAPPGNREFSIRTSRSDGRWRISVSGRTGQNFINHALIRLRLISDTAGDIDGSMANARIYSFIQTAPGEYRLTLPARVRLLDAVVFAVRKSARTAPFGPRALAAGMIGRIAPAAVPPPCLPATGHWRSCPWNHVVTRALNATAAEKKWRPWLKRAAWHCDQIPLIGAIGLILLALYFARTPSYSRHKFGK